MREVDLDLGAILAANGRLLLEGITCLGLKCPFAIKLCGIGILGGQGVGLVMGERRQMVDETRGSAHRATAAERHVFTALGLQQQTHSLLGIGGAKHGDISLTIVVQIIEGRILRLLGILSQDTESLVS